MKIKILNPVPGGATEIGMERAKRYVRAGRAVLIGGSLRFHVEHHGHRSAQQAAIRHTDGGYSRACGRGVATDQELANIPVINGRELIAPARKANPARSVFHH